MVAQARGTQRHKVALALQGGGSHGAFTWGVLDRLLEHNTIDIIGVTGTSAGAMNAICLADGLAQDGPEQARRQLRTFWEAVANMPGVGSLLSWLPGETLAHMRIEQTPPYMVMDAIRRNLRPEEFNPLRINPLRDLLDRMIDFDRLRAHEGADRSGLRYERGKGATSRVLQRGTQRRCCLGVRDAA